MARSWGMGCSASRLVLIAGGGVCLLLFYLLVSDQGARMGVPRTVPLSGGAFARRLRWLFTPRLARPPTPVAVPTADASPVAVATAAVAPARRRDLVFFTADLHVGTSADLVGMTISRGWKMIFATSAPDIHHGWMSAEQRSRFINLAATKPLTPQLRAGNPRAIFDYYKDDPIVRSVDAFICSFPSALCEAFLPFNKTIIFSPAHRFTLRSCTRQKWQHSTELVQRLAKSTNPRHFVAAMSRYDAEYLNYYTGVTALRLFSSSRAYVPTNPYKPTRPEILVGPLNLETVMLWGLNGERLPQEKVFGASKFQLRTARQLYGKFELSQLTQHRAAVVLPYAVMSYGMTELYAMGIPIFVPSEKWMRERPDYYPHDRTATQTVSYCGLQTREALLGKKYAGAKHPHSPESFADDAKFYWLKFADFYQWPHIQFFDSIADLDSKLSTLDLGKLHEQMLLSSKQRAEALDPTWKTIADGIDRMPRVSPTVYHPVEEFLAPL